MQRMGLGNNTTAVVPKQGLSAADLAAIEALAALCERHDGARLKLVWEMMRERPAGETNDFCCYDGDRLAGYLSFDPSGSQIEITGMVRPDLRRRGIGRTLLGDALAECRRRSASRVLLVGVRAADSGTRFAAAIGARYTVSEYRLELDMAVALSPVPSRLQLRRAEPADAPTLIRINAESFDKSTEEAEEYVTRVLNEPGSRVYLAAHDGEPIGSIGVIVEDSGAYLRGFGVLPRHQGNGYGRQILSATVAALAAEGYSRQALDVETENSNALGLYQSCGFQQTNCYDYYEIAL